MSMLRLSLPKSKKFCIIGFSTSNAVRNLRPFPLSFPPQSTSTSRRAADKSAYGVIITMVEIRRLDSLTLTLDFGTYQGQLVTGDHFRPAYTHIINLETWKTVLFLVSFRIAQSHSCTIYPCKTRDRNAACSDRYLWIARQLAGIVLIIFNSFLNKFPAQTGLMIDTSEETEKAKLHFPIRTVYFQGLIHFGSANTCQLGLNVLWGVTDIPPIVKCGSLLLKALELSRSHAQGSTPIHMSYERRSLIRWGSTMGKDNSSSLTAFNALRARSSGSASSELSSYPSFYSRIEMAAVPRCNLKNERVHGNHLMRSYPAQSRTGNNTT
ncbi:hypothetical protein EV361DRAFT_868942 [Lentinula raphanica]|uniref:Uncharacterized protein n=1 Tax=Lentinula raphanica TaxID=153919 RepID=A0AA38P4U5_9AGAR|nr:hypothetical protein F5878DRAFT_643707 [Lentinula raphanica]KAJ3970852.1 hypothetical protein EV361DRAFT_868942 [Lentinula raphanica]